SLRGFRPPFNPRLPPDDPGVTAEPQLPELMADHRDVRVELHAGFGRGERPPARDGSARPLEEVRGDEHRHDRYGSASGPPRVEPIHFPVNGIAREVLARGARV